MKRLFFIVIGLLFLGAREPRGLQNPTSSTGGSQNRCYMNAVLQCLYQLKDMNKAVVAREKQLGRMGRAYYDVLNTIKSTARGDSADLITFCGFGWQLMGESEDVGQKHEEKDAAEFLNRFLEELVGIKGESLDQTLFDLMGITLEMGDAEEKRIMLQGVEKTADTSTLTEALRGYFEQYGMQLKKTSKFFIVELGSNDPELAISFDYDNFDIHGLGKTVLHTSYKLKGIVLARSTGGHYTALVTSKDKWYFCDDVQIAEVPEQRVRDLAQNGFEYLTKQRRAKRMPVILFYEDLSKKEPQLEHDSPAVFTRLAEALRELQSKV